VPTLKEVWAKKNTFTKSASDLSRTMCLSGLGVVWIFRVSTKTGSAIPAWLMWCSLLIVLSLLFDLLQYVSGAYRVDRFARKKESEGLKDSDNVEYPLDHPKLMNRLWLAKIVAVGLAWAGLIAYVAIRALSESLPALDK
jgi:hypothetical protein